MIAFVEGLLLESGPPALVAVGGFGLTVHVPQRSAASLPAVGERLCLWTHLAVREDGWALYGFLSRAELELFRLLIGVSGIGPRLALGVLSGAAPAQIAGWLRGGDEQALARLPGIGRKTAARLVVELGTRVALDLGEAAGTAATGARGTASGDPLVGALAILQAMGLPPARAEQALRAARERDVEVAADVEAWVRSALRAL